MTVHRSIAAALVCAMLVGCSSTQRVVDGPVWEQCITDGGAKICAFDRKPACTDAKDCKKKERNAHQDALLRDSKSQCDAFLARTENRRDWFNTRLLTHVLAGTASIFGILSTSERKPQVLASGATIAGAVGAELDAYVPEEQAPVIRKGIELAQRRVKERIEAMQDCPVAQYSLGDAQYDAYLFHSQCSVVVAVDAINNALADAEAAMDAAADRAAEQIVAQVRDILPPQPTAAGQPLQKEEVSQTRCPLPRLPKADKNDGGDNGGEAKDSGTRDQGS